MRVIAGTYGGRKLKVPADQKIRPTSDKVRGSIFNALLSRIDLEGASVLDLFCGTGALGIEALSRGAETCLFVDKDTTSLALAKANAATLDISEAQFILADATRMDNKEDVRADLFFCDPPYRQDLLVPALENLHQKSWLAEGAIGVLELEKGGHLTLPEAYTLLKEKTYGDTDIKYVRYTA